MRRADKTTTFMCRLSLKSGSLNLLEPSGHVQAFNGIALPFTCRHTIYMLFLRIHSTCSTQFFHCFSRIYTSSLTVFNPLNPELNPICYLLALLGAHHFLHVSRIRVKLLTLRRLMSYTYGAPILDVSRSHTKRRSTVGRTPLDE